MSRLRLRTTVRAVLISALLVVCTVALAFAAGHVRVAKVTSARINPCNINALRGARNECDGTPAPEMPPETPPETPQAAPATAVPDNNQVPDTLGGSELDRGTVGQSTAVAGAEAGPVVVAGAGTSLAARGALPYTGAPVAWIALLGSLLLIAGVALRVGLRRRNRESLATLND